MTQVIIERDANGIVCGVVNFTVQNSGKYNSSIVLMTDNQLQICELMFKSPKTQLFMPIQMEADRQNIDIYTCIHELRKKHITIYQRLPYNLTNIHFIKVSAAMQKKQYQCIRVIDSDDTTIDCNVFLMCGKTRQVVGCNKEVWTLVKIAPTPYIIYTQKIAIACAILKVAESMLV